MHVSDKLRRRAQWDVNNRSRRRCRSPADVAQDAERAVTAGRFVLLRRSWRALHMNRLFTVRCADLLPG